MLHVVGFDTAAPMLIADFIRGTPVTERETTTTTESNESDE